MKESIRKFFKLFLLIAAVMLLLFLAVGTVLVLGWPWWVGGFLLLLAAGMWIGGFFLHKLWRRRREENFVKDMCEQDEARIRAASAQEKNELKELQQRWKSAIQRLRSSHLKKLGNPLYVLPWYMVIGESGSGKTTSLNSARIASPFADMDRVQGIAGTRQCDWYFFEQAILIDTAGRYTMPVNGEQDQSEWRKFLAMLLRYRRREPLNGLIVTVAADRLLAGNREELEKDGLTIRKRIDELMRTMGVRIPVYVLVTKCDLVHGINRFCESLPEKSLNQPMGIINQELSLKVESFVDDAVRTIDERLRNLRLQLLHSTEKADFDSALLLFPEEFAKVREGLVSFMTSAFRDNPYQETPALRGLFFSSGRQEGQPRSHFTATLEHAEVASPLPGTSKGLFLHDFFAAVLPRDRALLTPTRRALEWRALTGNLGLTAWVLLGVAVCGLLSFSFIRNLTTVREISQEFTRPAMTDSDAAVRLANGQRFLEQILLVEEKNRHWWLPRFGLNASIRVEESLKRSYCRQFRQAILEPFNRRLTTTQAAMNPATADELFARHVVHEMRRIHLIKARLAGQGLQDLLDLPHPPIGIESIAGDGVSDAESHLSSLYHHYLLWETDQNLLSGDLVDLQARLNRLLALKGNHLRWLATWVNTQCGLPAVSLQDFWGGSLSIPDEPIVPPAFTRQGKTALDELLAELAGATTDPHGLSSSVGELESWYRNAALAAWHQFAANFGQGRHRLRGPREWQPLAARMAGDEGPYFKLLNTLAMELEPLATTAAVPAWLQQVYQYQAVRAQGIVQDSGSLAKAASGGGKIVATLRRNVGREAAAEALETHLAGGKALQTYRRALASMAAATESRGQVFDLMTQTFRQDHGSGDNAVYVASAAGSELSRRLGSNQNDQTIAKLVSGPFDFLWDYSRREGACQLQSLWEEQVLAGTVGMSPEQAMPELVGPNGLVWRFVQGPAAPFVQGGRAGYGARQALGNSLPLESALFTFLRRGNLTQATVRSMERPRSFNVGIQGLPTNANANALFKPHATRLELQCGNAGQSLVNNNYPVSRTFSYAPDHCGDTILQIEVGDVLLSRHYSGPQGFTDFLKDMRGGSRTFRPAEFPGERQALARLGVTSITVNYRFTGTGPILQQTATLTGQAPRSIAQCWDQ